MSTDCIKGCLHEIPRRIRDLPKKESKGEIRRLLLNILVHENDYRVARKFCGSFILRIGEFLWFAGTNICGLR